MKAVRVCASLLALALAAVTSPGVAAAANELGYIIGPERPVPIHPSLTLQVRMPESIDLVIYSFWESQDDWQVKRKNTIALMKLRRNLDPGTIFSLHVHTARYSGRAVLEVVKDPRDAATVLDFVVGAPPIQETTPTMAVMAAAAQESIYLVPFTKEDYEHELREEAARGWNSVTVNAGLGFLSGDEDSGELLRNLAVRGVYGKSPFFGIAFQGTGAFSDSTTLAQLHSSAVIRFGEPDSRAYIEVGAGLLFASSDRFQVDIAANLGTGYEARLGPMQVTLGLHALGGLRTNTGVGAMVNIGVGYAVRREPTPQDIVRGSR
jgi:hypothetical protein